MLSLKQTITLLYYETTSTAPYFCVRRLGFLRPRGRIDTGRVGKTGNESVQCEGLYRRISSFDEVGTGRIPVRAIHGRTVFLLRERHRTEL